MVRSPDPPIAGRRAPWWALAVGLASASAVAGWALDSRGAWRSTLYDEPGLGWLAYVARGRAAWEIEWGWAQALATVGPAAVAATALSRSRPLLLGYVAARVALLAMELSWATEMPPRGRSGCEECQVALLAEWVLDLGAILAAAASAVGRRFRPSAG